MSLDTYPVAHVEAMQARLAELERDNEHLTQVIAAHRALADAHRELLARSDSERSKAMTVVRQVSGALDRLFALEDEAKQAREDEAWARSQFGRDWSVCVVFDPVSVTAKKFFGTGWVVVQHAETAAAALRALRAKVEGGAR